MGKIALGLMRIQDMSVDEVENLVLSSIEMGITFFDLADIYGRTKCEYLFGEVMLRHPEIREKIYIQTKVGIIPGQGYDLSFEYLINAVKASLERLKCGYLDSLLLHRPDVLMDNEEVGAAINRLSKEGLIKDFGVSNFSPSEIEYLKMKLELPIKYNQVQVGLGNTTMIDQTMYTNIPSNIVSKENDSLLFYMKSKGIIIQAWSPFQYSLFQGSIFDEGRFPQINNALNELARKYNTSKCTIATKFILMLDKNTIVVTGSTSLSHIKESLDALSLEMSKQDWYKLYKDSGHMLP